MKKKLLIVVGGIGALLFAWWTLSPLFINREVDDQLPPEIRSAFDVATHIPDPESSPTSSGVRGTEEVLETNTTETTGGPKSMRTAEVGIPTEAPKAIIDGPFVIEDTPLHPAEGSVRLIRTPEETIVRFEEYDGTNGPDLYVYLAKDLDAEEFVSLGRAKGNQGNINYSVPESVDIDEYPYVLTWCRAFGVLFDYAKIN